MTAIQVTARVPGKKGSDNPDDREVTIDFDFGDDLAQAVEMYGADVIYSKYKAEAVINLQGLIRSYIKANKTEEEINDLVGNWVPGVKAARGKSKEEKLREMFAGLNDEERQTFVDEYLAA